MVLDNRSFEGLHGASDKGLTSFEDTLSNNIRSEG